jgi:hypothetical protein
MPSIDNLDGNPDPQPTALSWFEAFRAIAGKQRTWISLRFPMGPRMRVSATLPLAWYR